MALNRPTEREPAHRPKSERRQGTASSDPGRARVSGKRASPPRRSGLGMTLTVLQGLTWGTNTSQRADRFAKCTNTASVKNEDQLCDDSVVNKDNDELSI